MAMTPEQRSIYNKRYREKRKLNPETYREREIKSAHKLKLEHPLRPILWNTKRKCRKEGIEFSITEYDFILPEYCPLLGIKLQTNFVTRKDNSYSIDRIDPTKGYTKQNTWVISWRANNLKCNASIQEIHLLSQNLKAHVEEMSRV
jgi:hypothetical protein